MVCIEAPAQHADSNHATLTMVEACEFLEKVKHIKEKACVGAKFVGRIHDEILHRITVQIETKTLMKKSNRKKIKRILARILRKILQKVFTASDIEKYDGNSCFGCDEIGRDVGIGLRRYVELLRGRSLNIHTVLVSGSRVKGGWTPESDVDVTIISSNLPKEGKNPVSKRLYDLKTHLLFSDRPLYLGIEPSVCLTKDEFLERLEQFDIESLDAIFHGRVIYDDGFWQVVKEKYKEMEKEFRLNEIPLKEKLLVV